MTIFDFTKGVLKGGAAAGALALSLAPLQAQDSDEQSRPRHQRPPAGEVQAAERPHARVREAPPQRWEQPAPRVQQQDGMERQARYARPAQPQVSYTPPRSPAIEQSAPSPVAAPPASAYGGARSGNYGADRQQGYGADRAQSYGAYGARRRSEPRGEPRDADRPEGRDGAWMARRERSASPAGSVASPPPAPVATQRDDRRDAWRSRSGNPGAGWNGNRDTSHRSDGYRNGSNGTRYAGNGGHGYDNGRGEHRRWDRSHWRNDRRYDWYRYRANNRSIFTLGRYYAPYRDYSYSRLRIGFRLGSLFFSSRYWIDDPWRYRLPSVYGPYRWVRYYDDALLVDIYSGEVVDVIYDFFW